MNRKFGDGLILIAVSIATLVLIVLLAPSSWLVKVLAVPFLLFSPGYCLILALFPDKERFGGTERVVLGLALSVALIAIVGILLNDTLWGISVKSVLFSVAGLTAVLGIIAAIRIYMLPDNERFRFDFGFKLPATNPVDKGLFVVLVMVILSSVGAVGYLAANSPREEHFSEFYLLSLDGQKNLYRSLYAGQESQFVVGIYNQLDNSNGFGIEVSIDGIKLSDTPAVNIAYKERVEVQVTVVPSKPGAHQKIEFSLRDLTTGEICQSIFLFADVL